MNEAAGRVTTGRLLDERNWSGDRASHALGRQGAGSRRRGIEQSWRGHFPVSLVAMMGLLLLLWAMPAWSSPMLYVDFGGSGSSTTIGLGESTTANIYATQIPPGSIDPTVGGPGLFGFGFDITFDSVGLQASNLDFGPLFSSTGFSSTVDNPGLAGLTANRFFLSNGPSGDDIFLGSIDFEGLAGGTYGLSLGYFTGAGDNTLFDGTFLDSDPGTFFTNASIEVVPEPGTATLLLVGVSLLAGARRSRA